MRYVAQVADRAHQVEVTESAPDHFTVRIDGRVIELDAPSAGGDRVVALHDNQVRVAHLTTSHGLTCVSLAGHDVSVEILDLRHMRLRRAQEAAGPQGPATLVAPMPGKVVAVLVSEGDTVEAGQGVLVVEAMKMENELRSPRAGVVRRLTAQVGSTVESGTPLCMID